MRTYLIMSVGLCAALGSSMRPARAQEVAKENVDGIVNFHRLQTTVACSGAIKPSAIPHIKEMGFASIINLREPTESGANLEEEAAAAKAAGLRYYSIPLNANVPDPAAADKFLEAITQKGTEPAFIHCAGGGRAATMWFIKRMAVDHWDVDRELDRSLLLDFSEFSEEGGINPELFDFLGVRAGTDDLEFARQQTGSGAWRIPAGHCTLTDHFRQFLPPVVVPVDPALQIRNRPIDEQARRSFRRELLEPLLNVWPPQQPRGIMFPVAGVVPRKPTSPQ